MTLNIFSHLKNKNKYPQDTLECIHRTVQKLLDKSTNTQCPGLLLGKIQSGKTRTFIGIIGLALEQGYDYCIILTKNTKPLVIQTERRLDGEFEELIKDDILRIYDIMKLPKMFTNYILNKKLIFIAKKQSHNLDRLTSFFENYPITREKKVLIIDDEADYASVGFKKPKKEEEVSEKEINLRTIAEKIGNLRGAAATDFLQVTATPYSLYLQPDKTTLIENKIFPTRPRFTELVPIHDQYVGGKVYFEAIHEKTHEELPWAKFLHIEVPLKEIEVLGNPDQRYLNNITSTPNLEKFRLAIITFLVGGTIRSLNEHPKDYKCSFIIHTEVSKEKHKWQHQLAESLISALKQDCKLSDAGSLLAEVRKSIALLEPSLLAAGFSLPSEKQILAHLICALTQDHIAICPINSDNDVLTLLDKKGQLQLDNPFNIFVGGQILDRGVTIENLLGFFYGRNPKQLQQDTVLQHSRMYGARSQKDLAVTRLYTTARLYQKMKNLHEFDTTLRDAFEKGEHNDGIVLLTTDPEGEIRPCSPTKILTSLTTTVTAHKRFLPIGFQTLPKTRLSPLMDEIDAFIKQNTVPILSKPHVYEISCENAKQLLKKIAATLVYSELEENEDYAWNVDEIIAILKRTCRNSSHMYCIIARERKISRFLSDRLTFSDAPDHGQSDLKIAKQVATDVPCLILTRQEGLAENGWRGHPFWWPVLLTPLKTENAIFANTPGKVEEEIKP